MLETSVEDFCMLDWYEINDEFVKGMSIAQRVFTKVKKS